MGIRLLVLAVVAGALPSVAAAPATTPAATTGAPAASPAAAPENAPWWEPVGLRGQTVTRVQAAGKLISVTAAGRQLVSHDGGVTFAAGSGRPASALPPGVDTEVRSGADVWALSAGRVLHGQGGGALVPDAGAPDLGAGARLLAAPAALPGWVVAVSDSGVVWWRDGATGSWGRALVLLPQGLFTGRPTITAVSAFAVPLSTSIYLATDGYSTLLSSDGGQDWLRAGPGLPNNVLSLWSDGAGQAVYAGTTDGLWVHRLRSLPGIPVYTGPDLLYRRLGAAAITLLALAAGLVVLWLGLRPRRSTA